MRIAVFGTGGVGGYFGGRLAQAGMDVTFIARGRHLQTIAEQGLRIDSIKGDFIIHQAIATDNPTMVGEVDAVLCCVKSWQIKEAALAMRPMIGPNTMVVPIQNGVEAPAILSDVIGSDKVLGGLCRIISMAQGPGHIRHVGAEPYITFGELNNQQTERTKRLYRAFSKATGLTVEIATDIGAALWKKFILIAPWSGVGAITRAPVGVFRRLPETRQLLLQSMEEVFNIAIAHEINLSKEVVIETMEFIDALPEEGTASMQRDIIEGRPSELNEQNGAVVRLSKHVGIQTPVNEFIYFSLLPLEMRARGKLQF
jgi:2-dehydropantoate 2-reductase